MTLNELLQIIERMPGRSAMTLTPSQHQVLEAAYGPLLVIAGPGSGKTEVLILRCLRLIYVDQINPRSLFVSTFTEKAARELQDRLGSYAAWISSQSVEAKDIDVAHIRIGTLHSLCNDIMHEFRFSEYQNFRLMDELEQLIFINEHSDLVRKNLNTETRTLWTRFGSVVGGFPNIPVSNRIRSRLNRAIGFRNIVGRLVEYRVNIQEMWNAGDEWATLADGYQDYVEQLENTYRSDFAHVQAKFLDFINSPRGKAFLHGDGTPDNPGISHVLVDEYQDTNPIQEEIYFSLAQTKPHNLTVVGDDDQAIYRFRGGTVDCLVGFESTCHQTWGNVDVSTISLLENHRSHERIVQWCNDFITSYPEMSAEGVRSQRAGNLIPASEITGKYGDYPSVSLITGNSNQSLARHFADTVRGMLDNRIISDPSDCALLMRSTRENNAWAQPYTTALQDVGISVHNPRNNAFLDQTEVKTALGTLVSVLDPDLTEVPRQLQRIVRGWTDAYDSNASIELKRYVRRAKSEISTKTPGQAFQIGTSELFYIILSFEPFPSWQQDITLSIRLAKLTQLLESYTSMPRTYDQSRTRNWLAASADGHEVSRNWLRSFYWGLVGILNYEGMNDDEDEYDLFPAGRLPIMTIFQAKGLQFPFVFVAERGKARGRSRDPREPSGTHEIESLLYPFRTNPPNLAGTDAERAIHDVARLYYVAYSRAQYGLFILAHYDAVDEGSPHLGPSGRQWLDSVGIPSLNEKA